ncbi:hypothetical protein PV08_03838 [Exophiala spinifera]|uniref:Biogenesis of lysosome-related organelles complex 1 subunit CNL1 n=1 Tax=Exophiala spinifera TaxID=91928 RepID=A0A0D2BDF4_9EURO|nr:uncharacterized protein PV08_03838 [Exophiala spinifera]KIW16650.1 hypothetical protein PV08_03838 [Exophiala spinifera]
MSAPPSVSDSALGLTQSELVLLRHHYQVVTQRHPPRGAMADRGRGTSRQSQPSSRAASAASSQSAPGRIVLDSDTLQNLYLHLENVMSAIQRRIDQLEEATAQSVAASRDRSNALFYNTNSNISRVHKIIAEIDRCEAEFEKAKRVRDRVKQLRNEVDEMDARLDRTLDRSSRPTSYVTAGTRPRR